MNNKKEVWYLWDSDTSRDMSFIKNVTAVKFKDGSYIVDIDDSSPFRQKPLMWFCWQSWSNNNIAAYSLGETRDRLKCYCDNGRVFEPVIWSGDSLSRECYTCKGKGWVRK